MNDNVRLMERLIDHRTIGHLLALHGIPYEPLSGKADETTIRFPHRRKDRYCVSVFDMEAVQLLRLAEGSSMEPGDAASEPTESRIARLAVRAVYAAGLDFADVTIRLDRSDSAVVERIDPSHYSQTIARLAEKLERNNQNNVAADVQLGMDPEFILLSERGKIVPASRYLAYRGSAGYDSATVRGRDGIHPLAELRPLPSSEPDRLIRNLRRTMWIAAARINDPTLRWIAGSMPIPGLPLGGHIHFSGIRLTASLLRALDNYLALPLLMLEDASGVERRKKYGRLGDVRLKSHGGFEYRTLPSLLMSPTVTKGAVALAKLIAIEYSRLKQRPLDRTDNVEAYYGGDKLALAEIVESIWGDIAMLDSYTKYNKYLVPLKKWIDTGRTLNESADFRLYWRVPPYGYPARHN